MKLSRSALIGLALSVGAPALAAEVGYTVRATDIKQARFTDSRTLASLEPSAKVEVLTRQDSWYQVKSQKTVGWVKLWSLRFEQRGAKAAPGGDLGKLFNVASTGSGAKGSVATGGIKGLSASEVLNAAPNPAALRQMNEFQVSQAEAQEFARAGKLNRQTMDYVAPGEQK